jgi:hypothetical protein
MPSVVKEKTGNVDINRNIEVNPTINVNPNIQVHCGCSKQEKKKDNRDVPCQCRGFASRSTTLPGTTFNLIADICPDCSTKSSTITASVTGQEGVDDYTFVSTLVDPPNCSFTNDSAVLITRGLATVTQNNETFRAVFFLGLLSSDGFNVSFLEWTGINAVGEVITERITFIADEQFVTITPCSENRPSVQQHSFLVEELLRKARESLA